MTSTDTVSQDLQWPPARRVMWPWLLACSAVVWTVQATLQSTAVQSPAVPVFPVGDMSLPHTALTGLPGAVPGAVAWPFVWLDVVVVYVLSALPLGAAVVALLPRSWSQRRIRCLGLASLCCGLSYWWIPLPGDGRLTAAVGAAELRSLLAVLLASGVTLLCSRRMASHPEQASPAESPAASPGLRRLAASWAWLVCGLAGVWIVPEVYIRQRVQHDAQQIQEWLEQSRLGEASSLLDQLLLLQPGAQWQQQSLSVLRVRVRQQVADLLAQTQAALPVDASNLLRLQRARQLAMLGQTTAAELLLRPLVSSDVSAAAATLLATIHETRGAWSVAVDWYVQAGNHWRQQPPSAAAAAGLYQTLQGLAYCERKRGRLAEAEQAWQQLLALAPTAETHFLLARFYEDTQQAEQALLHLRAAMRLAPSRYAKPGQQLLDKLQSLHFGCLHVYRRRLQPEAPQAAADSVRSAAQAGR